MTKIQLLAKVKEMGKQLPVDVVESCMKIIDSKAANYKDAENTYFLPKMILSGILQNLAEQYEPFTITREQRKLINKFKIIA